MLKALVAVQIRRTFRQLSGRMSNLVKHKTGNKLLVVLLTVYLVVSLTFSIGSMLQPLLIAFAPLGLQWLYFSMCGIMAFAISFIGSVFLSQHTLFEAKDNDLLLSLPIPPRLILLSRMLSLYFITLLFEAFVILPGLGVYIIWGQPNFAGVLFALLASLLMPLMVLALSCLLGWVLAQITARLKWKNLIIIMLSLGFLAAYFLGYSKAISALNNLTNTGMQLAEAVKTAIFPAYHFGMAALGSLPGLMLFAACAIIPFAAMFFILSANYQTILTTKHASRKTLYRGGGLKAGGRNPALVKKEWKRLFGSPMYLLNAGIGLFMMLALPILLLFSDSVQEVLKLVDVPDAKGVLSAAALSFLASTVFISAPSISLEGKSLWVLQTLPLHPMEIFLAKAKAHIVLSTAAVFVSGMALFLILKLSLPALLLLWVLPSSISVFMGLLGILLNLRFPKMRWMNEMEPVKQSMSTFLCMMIGNLSVIGLALLYIFVVLPLMNPGPYLLACTAFYLMSCLLIYLYLRRHASKKWQDLSEA